MSKDKKPHFSLLSLILLVAIMLLVFYGIKRFLPSAKEQLDREIETDGSDLYEELFR